MHITHSYIGTINAPYRCLFFLLIEDYIQAQTQFARELDLHLERFARKLGDSSALVRPFTGDIETVRQHVLEKPWSAEELYEIKRTPALLMINQDFKDFNPRKHPWLVIHIGGVTGNYGERLQFEHILDDLAEIVHNANEDYFTAAYNLKHEIEAIEYAKIFEAKPGIFGLSIDLFRTGDLLEKIFKRSRRMGKASPDFRAPYPPIPPKTHEYR
jgi:hypothetical protein